MRVRPTATGTFSREVPPEGDTIHGHFLPGGTTISPNLSSLMRSKTIFGEDVDIFRPERFLEVDQEQREEMQRTVEHIFGYGRWMCAGKAIAWIELNKTLFEVCLTPRVYFQPTLSDRSMSLTSVRIRFFASSTSRSLTPKQGFQPAAMDLGWTTVFWSWLRSRICLLECNLWDRFQKRFHTQQYILTS